MTELKDKVLRGVMITLFKEGWSKCWGVLGIMLLARILFPADFGYIAIVYVVTDFLSIFLNKGILVALIRHEQVDDGILAGALSVCAGLGGLLTIMLFVSAPWLADFFHAPVLADFFRVVSPAIFFRAMSVVPGAIVQKRLHFLRGAFPRAVAECVFWIFSVFLAWRGHGVMSLAWAMVAAGFAGMVLNWSVAVLDWKLCFLRGKFQDLWRSGGMVVLIEVAEYLILNIRLMVVLPQCCPVALGFYFLAFRFSNYFYQKIALALSGVFFPVFSFLKDEQLVRAYFLKAVFYIAIVVVPFYSIAFLFNHELVLFVYGEKWLPMALPLGVLSLAGIVKGICIGGINRDILYAKGSLNTFLRLKIMIGLFNAAAVFLGLSHGIIGVAVAVTGAGLISAACVVTRVIPLVRVHWREYVFNFRIPFAASFFMGAIILLLKQCLPAGNVSSLAIIILGAGVYVGLLQAMGVHLLREMREIIFISGKYKMDGPR